MINKTPERQNGLRTYNRIIKTAKTLFSKKGYHGTSINEIISKSKIATGSFYQYFGSKRDLYDYLVKDYRYRIFHTINEKIKGLTKRYDIEYEGIKAYLEFVIKDKLAYQIIWESLFVDNTYFYDYYESFAKSYAEQLIKSNEIREGLNIEVLSYCLIGISNFVGIQILSKPNILAEDVDMYVKAILDILSTGIFKASL
ncbi:MAG: TetR/AcrR family transcriptional regulator [Acholeplasmatales bacterium]|jgi:AcrR family transcriptional regulator|nr:TetR/AcrR family transcriptional regulator [Acholeplasmatales bacterium]